MKNVSMTRNHRASAKTIRMIPIIAAEKRPERSAVRDL